MSARPAPRDRFRLPSWGLPLLLGLALLSASLNKGFWGAHGEARRAEVAREVLQDGRWLEPTLLGRPFITKPPLLYWSSALCMRFFGVEDWAARLPALLATLGAWLALLSLGRAYAVELRLERSGTGPQAGEETADDAGQLAAAALVGLPLVLAMGLNAETEPLLLCCTAAAVAATLALPPRGEISRPLGPRLLPGVFLAAGFMVKGPLGWLFPLFGMLAFELGLPRARRRLAWGDAGLILLLQALLALPWFLLVLARDPGALNLWLGESVARLADADFQVHREPWWYYLPRLAVFLPPLLFLGRGAWRDRVGRIPLVWVGLGLLFLSLAASKRTHYLLSLAPAVALLPLAADRAGAWAGRRRRLLHGLTQILPWLVPAASAWLLARGLLEPTPVVLGALGLALAGIWWLRRRSAEGELRNLTLAMLLVLLTGAPTVLTAVDAYRSPRAFYLACAGSRYNQQPVLNWRNDRYSASFYMRRAIPSARNEAELDSLAPRGGWLLCQEQDLEPLSRPHRVVLRRDLRDPFLTARRRVWVMAKLDAAQAARPGVADVRP